MYHRHALSLAIIIVMLSGCIVKKADNRDKFITFGHNRHIDLKPMLISKIDKQHWKIGYRYAVACPAEFRQKEAQLQKIIIETLRAWLQPLRELQPAQPITDDFRFLKHKDYTGNIADDNEEEGRAMDVGITFECKEGFSFFVVGRGGKPSVHIREDLNIDKGLVNIIIHELGHAFGMGDSYSNNRRKSTGGLKKTAGKQPMAIMSAFGDWQSTRNQHLSEDDVRGMQWLYKRVYEGLAIDDCFFPDYVFEEKPAGCRPKYPFIFEIKYHGHTNFALQMLDEDPTIDVNAQDDGGFTALHYAVMREDTEIVTRLLARQDIKPFLRNKQGHSALRLARDAKLDKMVKLLLEHPLTLSVDAKGKQITTWGELKQQ